MFDYEKQQERAQLACLEASHANALIVTECQNWHEQAQRLISSAYRRINAILVDVSGDWQIEAEMVTMDQYARRVISHLMMADQYMAADLCYVARMSLVDAQEPFWVLLENLRAVIRNQRVSA